MRKKLFPVSFSALLVLLLILNGCSQKNDTSFNQQIYNSIPESEGFQEIFHIEVINSGFLVFYRMDNELKVGIIDEELNWITKSGSASLNPEEGLSVVFSNRQEEALYFSYGVINNPDVVEVISSSERNEEKAKIIKTNEGVRLWFVFYEKPTESILPDIIGVSEEGQHLVNSNE